MRQRGSLHRRPPNRAPLPQSPDQREQGDQHFPGLAGNRFGYDAGGACTSHSATLPSGRGADGAAGAGSACAGVCAAAPGVSAGDGTGGAPRRVGLRTRRNRIIGNCLRLPRCEAGLGLDPVKKSPRHGAAGGAPRRRARLHRRHSAPRAAAARCRPTAFPAQQVPQGPWGDRTGRS